MGVVIAGARIADAAATAADVAAAAAASAVAAAAAAAAVAAAADSRMGDFYGCFATGGRGGAPAGRP